MAFPRSVRGTAWRTLLNFFKSDPILSREVKTWRVWKGNGRDKPELTTKSVPYLLMEPHPDKTKWADNGTVASDYLIDVEMGLSSEDPADLMDFWSALENVIYPPTNARYGLVWDALNRVGIDDVNFEQGDWGNFDAEADGSNLIVGRGRIRLTLNIQQKDF